MSAVNVLAVMGTQASMARVDGRPECGDQLEQARAAVAELIEAADQARLALYGVGVREDAQVRLDAALARVQGAQP